MRNQEEMVNMDGVRTLVTTIVSLSKPSHGTMLTSEKLLVQQKLIEPAGTKSDGMKKLKKQFFA